MILKQEEILKYLESFDTESRAIRKHALSLSWYMRGGATYEDVIMLSNSEKELINELVKEHMDTTKNTKLPFF